MPHTDVYQGGRLYSGPSGPQGTPGSCPYPHLCQHQGCYLICIIPSIDSSLIDIGQHMPVSMKSLDCELVPWTLSLTLSAVYHLYMLTNMSGSGWRDQQWRLCWSISYLMPVCCGCSYSWSGLIYHRSHPIVHSCVDIGCRTDTCSSDKALFCDLSVSLTCVVCCQCCVLC